MAELTVKVRYNNILRSAAGVTEETIDLPADASVLDLLRQVSDCHGPRLESMLFESDGSLVSHVVVFRNQKLVPQGQYEQQLAAGDELMLFPAVSGG